MSHKTQPYILAKDNKYYLFDTEKDACAFLGVPHACVSSAYKRGKEYFGFNIIKPITEQETYRNKKLHRVWDGIKERCNNKNCSTYKYYGERGINICEEWMEYLNFAKWAFKNGYRDGLTIDRIDNDKGYSPDNCRWVTKKIQANNTRRNKYLIYNGERRTLAEWAEKFNLSYHVLQTRLSDGWDIEEALTIPKLKNGTTRKTFKNHQNSLSENMLEWEADK